MRWFTLVFSVVSLVFLGFMCYRYQKDLSWTKWGKYESVEKSCPTLYGLGLRGSMSIQEGVMLLEKEAQRRGWGFGWQQFAFVDHKEKKTFEIWWNPEKGETDLFVNGVLQGRSHAPKA